MNEVPGFAREKNVEFILAYMLLKGSLKKFQPIANIYKQIYMYRSKELFYY